jgi:hypothetical protein
MYTSGEGSIYSTEGILTGIIVYTVPEYGEYLQPVWYTPVANFQER